MAGDGVRGCAEGKNCWGMAARECDSCKQSTALLFCRADSAFLCGACDAKVHKANKFASRHERVWMCEVCEQAPAAVTCKADAAMLCVVCDADIHSANPLARRHERFAVVPFYESPAADTAAIKFIKRPDLLKPSNDDEHDGVNETEPSWVLQEPSPVKKDQLQKVPSEFPELKTVEYFFSDVDPYLDLDDAPTMAPRYDQTDSVVPVQTKDAADVASPIAAPGAASGCIDFDFCRPKLSYSGYSVNPSMSSSEAGVVPDANAMVDITYPYGRPNGLQLTGEADREARLMRYREKRKSRKFEKTIRYASRKAYAETRPRIKGRFAKRTQDSGETLCGGAADILNDGEYGVVPSF